MIFRNRTIKPRRGNQNTGRGGREILLGELKNTPSYQPYMDSGFDFQYVFCRTSNPKDTLVNVVLTKKDYAK